MHETGFALEVRAFHVLPDMPSPEGERRSHAHRVDVVLRRDDLDERSTVVDLELPDRAPADPADRWLHDRLPAASGGPPGATPAMRVWESQVGGYPSCP
ncbi:hypothetical protein [Geodermatophilus sp. CPCC 205761]|uniref:hypothetical protein n=1 Tax=Geodermatophilus sp. CPCC 205761 TaxID=2936597 RepID=UPI003EF035AF